MPFFTNDPLSGMALGSIVTLSSAPCGDPFCTYCYQVTKPSDWVYQTPDKPGTGAVVGFTAEDFPTTGGSGNTMGNEYIPLSNTERVTDLEEEVQNLRAAVLDLTKVVEYLLIWTGKKGNKMDRDKYLEGYIDPIREIL